MFRCNLAIEGSDCHFFICFYRAEIFGDSPLWYPPHLAWYLPFAYALIVIIQYIAFIYSVVKNLLVKITLPLSSL